MFYKIFCILIMMIITLSSPVFISKIMAAEDADTLAIAEDSLDLVFNSKLIVEDIDLDEMRGAALDLEVLGVAFFDAVSLNNSTSGTLSGGNVIDEGAFSDSSGLSTIIQNSGNNVLIQSATILNLNID